MKEEISSKEELFADAFVENCKNNNGKVSFRDGKMICVGDDDIEMPTDQTGANPEVQISAENVSFDLSYDIQRIILQEIEKVLNYKKKK